MSDLLEPVVRAWQANVYGCLAAILVVLMFLPLSLSNDLIAIGVMALGVAIFVLVSRSWQTGVLNFERKFGRRKKD